MKPAFLFFLCCSFLLLSGSNHVQLPVSLHDAYTNYTTFKEKLPRQAIFHPGKVVVQSTATTEDNYDLPNAIEPEDTDDEDAGPSGKFLQWNSCFLHLFHIQLSGHPQRYRKDRLPTCEHLAQLASDKCITYRVIRI